MLDQQGRVFGKVNLIDLSIVVVVALFILGAGLARTGNAGVNQQLKGEATAEFDLFIRGGISDPAMFKAGDKTFITIRNQPYAPLTIRKVKVTPRTVTVPAAGGVKAYPDPSEPYSKDVLLTLRETAQLTDDAIVLGGNKIKVGVPIDIEGRLYRLRGSIVDVRLVDQPKL
ncbi:MAG TPA: DUF4330 domain-containing protein [Pantanalinema sp.]